MKVKLLTVLTLTGIATSIAYASSGYDYMQGTSLKHAQMHPAVFSQQIGYHTAGMRTESIPPARAMHVMSHGGSSAKAMAPAAAPKADIVDTAVAAGSFNTLVVALKAAGLVDTLKGKGPFTVFAPTDAAFAKLPAGTLDGLLADKAQLTKVLTYHVVAGEVMSGDLSKVQSVKSLEGSDIPVSAIKASSVDIMTSNGIIHVVDEVLIPKS